MLTFFEHLMPVSQRQRLCQDSCTFRVRYILNFWHYNLLIKNSLYIYMKKDVYLKLTLLLCLDSWVWHTPEDCIGLSKGLWVSGTSFPKPQIYFFMWSGFSVSLPNSYPDKHKAALPGQHLLVFNSVSISVLSSVSSRSVFFKGIPSRSTFMNRLIWNGNQMCSWCKDLFPTHTVSLLHMRKVIHLNYRMSGVCFK